MHCPSPQPPYKYIYICIYQNARRGNWTRYKVCSLWCPFLGTLHQKLDKILVKLTKSICNILQSCPNILTHLSRQVFGIEVFSPLPRYATMLRETLTQMLTAQGPQEIFTKAQSNMAAQIPPHTPTTKHVYGHLHPAPYTSHKNIFTCTQTIQAPCSPPSSLLHENWYKNAFSTTLTPSKKNRYKKFLDKLATFNITTLPNHKTPLAPAYSHFRNFQTR